jgi:predicted O-methyltransferase YrrM
MIDFDIKYIKKMIEDFEPLPLNEPFLDGRYNWQRDDNGVEWPYYRFFHKLAASLKPKLTVELGGYQGTGAAHFAAGNPDGTVVTIDHHTDPGDEVNNELMLQAVMRFQNIVYLQGWTVPEVALEQHGNHALGNAPSAYETVRDIGRKIDILFIDSWHVYEYAKADWEAYGPLLNSPALVICDDILDEDRPGFPITGMRKFWEELEGDKFLEDTLHPGSRIGFLKV